MLIYKIIFCRTEMWTLEQELKISSRASHRAAQLPAPYSGKHLCWCQVGAWKLTLEADDLTGSSFKFLKSSLHPDSSRLFWIWSRWKLFIQAFNQVMVFDKWWMGLKIQRKTTVRHTNEVRVTKWHIRFTFKVMLYAFHKRKSCRNKSNKTWAKIIKWNPCELYN